MKNIFIPYELAKELKELGFDEECLGHYSDWINQEPFLLTCEIGQEQESCAIRRKNFLCKAPTWEQAFQFFRDNYNLDYEISYAGKKREYHAFVKEYIYGNNKNSPSIFSYEQAREECLKKLIQIVKDGTQTYQK